MKYRYIVIEGNIGAGKTTLACKMSQQFNARLILEQFEENSFLPKFYENPARFAFPLELSFLAERYQQIKQQITNIDIFHPMTVADYFINKSLIFASKTLEEDEFTLYSRLFHIIISVVPQPDLLVYLYVDIDRLIHNITQRGRSYEQKISPDYLEKIQKGYLDYIRQLTTIPVVIIDTNKLDFVKSQDDYTLLLEIIGQDYTPGVHRIIP
ncbi:MAG: hypothetical protein FJY10_01185 [Bacteroidetes bacterium]|nr:hypothetical protein [Bacteroidota bacterium]